MQALWTILDLKLHLRNNSFSSSTSSCISFGFYGYVFQDHASCYKDTYLFIVDNTSRITHKIFTETVTNGKRSAKWLCIGDTVKHGKILKHCNFYLFLHGFAYDLISVVDILVVVFITSVLSLHSKTCLILKGTMDCFAYDLISVDGILVVELSLFRFSHFFTLQNWLYICE
jgi:hypothetical protein